MVNPVVHHLTLLGLYRGFPRILAISSHSEPNLVFLAAEYVIIYDSSNFHNQLKILNPMVYYMTVYGLYRSFPKISAIF